MDFNPKAPTLMHIDINSCFATIEQQANPLLRGHPLVVAAYVASNGCVLAASIEAKKIGIKTGMRVCDAKKIYPSVIVLPPDPEKYRDVHLKLRRIVASYTNDFAPKSIDEFVLNLEGYPSLAIKGMWSIAREIKSRIRSEVGEWISVSIGIGPNKFLAKTAAGLTKPDGLDEINKDNYLQTYQRLKLTELCGIAFHNEIRLNRVGILTVTDFYNAPLSRLKAAFSSINGYYWYLRLRGWEADGVEFGRRSYGNSVALPSRASSFSALSSIVYRLVEKSSFRLRNAGFVTRGVGIAILFRDGSFWHRGEKINRDLSATVQIYKEIKRILQTCPSHLNVSNVSVCLFNLVKNDYIQSELFDDVFKKRALTFAQDKINKRWGDFVLTSPRSIQTENLIKDRIAFGGVREL